MSVTFQETLRGSWFPVDRPDEARLCEVVLAIRVTRAGAKLQAAQGELSGMATFDGLATAAPVQGELRLEARAPRRLTYAFEFATADGRLLRFSGAKHVRLMRPIASATTLWGELVEQGHTIATVRLSFDVRRDFVAFLQSLRRPPPA